MLWSNSLLISTQLIINTNNNVVCVNIIFIIIRDTILLVMISMSQYMSILFSPAVGLCVELHSGTHSNFRIYVHARSIRI